MYDGVGCGGVGWAPLQNVQQTTSTTVFAGGLCNASLQSSHLTRARRRLQLGGRGLEPRRIISGCLQLTPLKTSLVAFGTFLGGF